MPTALTDEQRREVRASVGSPAELVDPVTGERFRLVPLEAFDEYVERMQQEAWARASRQAMAKRLAEDGPFGKE